MCENLCVIMVYNISSFFSPQYHMGTAKNAISAKMCDRIVINITLMPLTLRLKFIHSYKSIPLFDILAHLCNRI
jgi:hypothetical protein